MREYPGFVFGETTRSLLEMHLALYDIYKKDLQIEQPYLIAAIDATLPRVYLELGLAKGNIANVQSGIKGEKDLPPYIPGTALVLALKENNKRLTGLELKFLGNKELLQWKEWRIEGLGEYVGETFAPFDSELFSNIQTTNSTAILHANQKYRTGQGLIRITDQTIEVKIHEVIKQSASRTHLYEHVLEFPKGLDTKTIELLQKAG